jgi:toxin ParE1/3/4
MTGIELAREIQDDFDRILDHLSEYAVEDAPGRIREIIQAIDVLQHNPLIGRPVSGDTRELVIGRRARGYVALYRYIEQIDTVFVLAIRSQRRLAMAELTLGDDQRFLACDDDRCAGRAVAPSAGASASDASDTHASSSV